MNNFYLKKPHEFNGVAWTLPDLVKDLIGAIYKPTLPIPPCISDNTSASQTIQASDVYLYECYEHTQNGFAGNQVSCSFLARTIRVFVKKYAD